MSCAPPNIFPIGIAACWGAYCEDMDEYLKPATKTVSRKSSARTTEELASDSRGTLKTKIASSFGIAEKKIGE